MTKNALVTGGTRGIGASVSISLKKAGYNVAATYNSNTEKANAFASEHEIEVFQWNVADSAACEAGVKQVQDKMGSNDILINNAGISKASMAHKMSVEQWDDVIRTDLDSVFYMTRCVLEGMREKSFGRIITISSINGQKGEMGLINYSAAKAGVIALTKSLGKELADKDIAVNCVTPAAAKTRIFDQISQEHIDYMLSKIPRGRFVKVEELESLVDWMASEENSFTTGAVFDLSGGRATY